MVRVPLLSSLAFPFVTSSYTSPDCVSVFVFCGMVLCVVIAALQHIVLGVVCPAVRRPSIFDIRDITFQRAPFHSGDPIRP